MDKLKIGDEVYYYWGHEKIKGIITSIHGNMVTGRWGRDNIIGTVPINLVNLISTPIQRKLPNWW